MRLSIGSLLATSLLATSLVLVTGAVTKLESPPLLYRENPNAYIQERAVDLNYRLPNETEPFQYNIELTTNVHKGEREFSGVVKIDLTVVEATNRIVVHARQLRDFKATIRTYNDSNTQPEALDAVIETEREFLNLTRKVSNPFPANTNWTLTIEYKGTLRTDNRGFYLSTYKDTNNNTRFLATTQFESTDARHGFPCYDEPAKRAIFVITMNHDTSYTAISNMPVNSTASSAGRTVFQPTVRMSTYLIAFIVSDFEYTEGNINHLPQRIYSRPGTEHDQEWALVSGMLIVQRLAEYFRTNFTLPKLDQVAVPDFAAGAMENWGLVTYREEYLLYNNEKSTVNTQTNIANIIAHEYTHQWFGNLVAVRWWTYLWLKEGFATLFSFRGIDETYPEWDVYQMFHTDEYQRALINDAYPTSRPMSHYVQKPNEISSLYDSVSYSKAGSVLAMWQHALTDKVFQRGLSNYLRINALDSAEEWNLFEAIQIAAKEENYPVKYPIRDMMSSWTQQGGYPLLTVTRNYNDGTFTVKQEPFFNNENEKAEKSWYVPINYAYQSNPDFRHTEASHYIPKGESHITITDKNLTKDTWLILNKQSTGYYRINYDEQNWNLIIDGLVSKSHKFHPRNRAQLLHDSYRLCSSNRLKQDICMRLLTYLNHEDQYAPWSTANAIITTYNRYLSGDKNYNDFKRFISDLLTEPFDKFGVNDVHGEQHFRKYTRSIVVNLACLVGIEDCLKETNQKLKALVNRGAAVEPNLQSPTYCNGLRQADDVEFFFMHEKLMNSEYQAERRLLISSLGCSQKAEQIKRFISSSVDKSNKLRVQERPTLLRPAYSRGEVGLLESIEFLKSNWLEYSNLQGGFSGGNPLDDDIRGISEYVVNTDQAKKLTELVDLVKGSDKVKADLEDAVKRNIQANTDWLTLNRDPLMNWIINFQNNGTGDGNSGAAVTITTFLLAIMLLVTRLI